MKLRKIGWALAGMLLLAAWLWQQRPADVADMRLPPASRQDAPALPGEHASNTNALPVEARDTLQRIQRGGPFRHRQDGSTFQNRERRLPQQARGYYREYTVETPGSDDRGARRIVAGGKPPSEFWYTDDHYRSFRQVQP